MFNRNDYIRFAVTIFDKDGFPIRGVYELPENIDLNFSLPPNSGKVMITEYGENRGNVIKPFRNIIGTIYLGQVKLLDFTQEGTAWLYCEDKRNTKTEKKEVLIQNSQIIKVLEDSEIVMGDLEEIEKYIRQLSCQIGSFQNQATKIKKLLNQR